MIKDDQVKSFNEKGYLVIENLLPENILKELQKVTDDKVVIQIEQLEEVFNTHLSNLCLVNIILNGMEVSLSTGKKQ